MTPADIGLLFALGALFAWGFGDFLIQRATRIIGIWRSLFYISATGAIILFPFIKDDLPHIFPYTKELVLLIATGLVIFVAALLDLEALKEGKIAVIEPILGLELPVAVGLSMFFLNESLSASQLALITTTFIGIILAVTEHHTHLHYHKRIFERGVRFAIVASVLMGAGNFFVGIASQETSPLLAAWFRSMLIAILYFAALWMRKDLRNIIHDFKERKKMLFAESIIDNAAWIFFSFAVLFIPISIATTVSESYIILAVLLGIFVNKEKLKWHQMAGIVFAVLSVLLLASITSAL